MEHTNNNSTLSNEELEIALKKNKSMYFSFTVIFSLLVLLAIYITYKDGFSFFSVFPIFFLPMAIKRYNDYFELKEEVSKRSK